MVNKTKVSGWAIFIGVLLVVSLLLTGVFSTIGFENYFLYDDFQFYDANKWDFENRYGEHVNINDYLFVDGDPTNNGKLYFRGYSIGKSDCDWKNSLHEYRCFPYYKIGESDCGSSMYCDLHFGISGRASPKDNLQDEREGSSNYEGANDYNIYEEPPIYAIPTKDLHEADLKVDLESYQRGYRDHSYITLLLNDVEVFDSGSREGRWLVEIEHSFLNPEIVTVYVDGRPSHTVNITNPEGDQRFKIMVGALTEGEEFNYAVHSVKYKYAYNCELEADEVRVTDTFAPGSEVDINSLSFEPVQFCLDFPLKARSFTEEGVRVDDRGETLQKLVRGETLNVPEDEEWYVTYIAKYQDGMTERCNIGEAYDTESQSCIDPRETEVVQCTTDSDCKVPPGCEGVEAICVSGECQFNGTCIRAPTGEATNIWEGILDNAFFNWIAGFFT